MNAKRTILVFGSFDMLHQGHRYFLRRSREHGSRLVVVLARDEEILSFKERHPAWNFEQRKSALFKSGLVDNVVSSDIEYGTFQVLQQYGKIDQILLGDGQEDLGKALEMFFQVKEEFRCPIVHIAPLRRKWHSSTRRHQLRLLLAHLALFGALFFWASGWTLSKLIASSNLAPPLAATLRLSLLAFFFFLWKCTTYCYKAQKESEPLLMKNLVAEFAIDRRHFVYLVISGLSFAIYNLCLFYGLNAIFLNRGGVLTSVLIPSFSAMFYCYIYKVRLRPRQTTGLLLGLLSGLILLGGLDYVSFVWHNGFHSLTKSLKGLNSWQMGQSSLFILAALAWSVITQLSGKIQKSYSLQKYSFYTYSFAALWTGWGWFWYDGTIHWLPLLGLVLLGSILGTSLYFWTLRFLPPHYVAGFLFLNPVCILLMSWLLLSEPWSLNLIIGSILAIGSIILLNRKYTKITQDT